MDNRTEKKLLRAFIVIYLASFFVINWNDVSWIFNYREVSGLLYDFFNPYGNSEVFANYGNVPVPTIPADSVLSSNGGALKQVKFVYSDQTNNLEIPAISTSAPIVFPAATNTEILENYLDRGVVFYPGSVMPGQAGQIIILGHSAPLNWPKIKYDWVFSDLNNLGPGDEISLTLDHKKYSYRVAQKEVIDKGQEISFKNADNILILVTCWPPGKDLKRMVIEAVPDLN